MRVTQASTNHTSLGEPAFPALTRLVRDTPALAVDDPDGASEIAALEVMRASL